MRKALISMVVLLSATAVHAQETSAPACTAVAPPPTELAAWSKPVAGKAAGDTSGLSAAIVVPGNAIDATLSPTGAIRYAAKPGREIDGVSFGGMFALEIKQAGSYRIALGNGSWINLLQNGKPLTSSTHGHGPDCSGIRKMVDFVLTPGRYILQIEGSRTARVETLIVKLP